jgi:hypothetical protein
MVDIIFQLHGSNNDTITFDNVNYVLNPETIGFGIPATRMRIQESAGVGGIFRHSKRGVRSIDLPVTILGENRAEVQQKARRMGRILQNELGPSFLRAIYPGGQTLDLRFYYTGGAESQYGGETGGKQFLRWVISGQAPQPFWESQQIQVIEITGGGTGRSLLPQLTKLKVSSSTGLGQVAVFSQADVEVFPIWRIEGPIENFTASNGTSSFTIEDTILVGETWTVNTEKKTVVDQDGVNKYDKLGVAPKIFPFRPGASTITVTGSGSTGDTRITVTYALRFEVLH